MERHRLLAVLLQSMASYISTSVALLDVAPNDATTRVLERMKPPRRIGLDFDPGADGRNVDVQASIEALPFASDSFDVIICYHVLEHVVDDGRAMREIGRVLMPVASPWCRSRGARRAPPMRTPPRRRRSGLAASDRPTMSGATATTSTTACVRTGSREHGWSLRTS
jgi:SAM-dependent methyltransferase